jgi:hypothetical protein
MRIRIITIIAGLATAFTLVGLNTSGAAMAAAHKPDCLRASATGVPFRNDPWDYSDTKSGNCGDATLVADVDRGGKIVIEGQLTSVGLVPILGGRVTFIWSWPGGGSSKSWAPRAASGDWISPQMKFTAPVGDEVTVLMTGYIVVPEGTCSIENPHLQFPA